MFTFNRSQSVLLSAIWYAVVPPVAELVIHSLHGRPTTPSDLLSDLAFCAVCGTALSLVCLIISTRTRLGYFDALGAASVVISCLYLCALILNERFTMSEILGAGLVVFVFLIFPAALAKIAGVAQAKIESRPSG